MKHVVLAGFLLVCRCRTEAAHPVDVRPAQAGDATQPLDGASDADAQGAPDGSPQDTPISPQEADTGEVVPGSCNGTFDRCAPWRDGTWRLARMPFSFDPTGAGSCGDARLWLPLGPEPDGHRICQHAGWIYLDTYGEATRIERASGRVEILTTVARRDPATRMACRPSGVVFASIYNPTLSDALVEFEDATAPGRVIWSASRRDAPDLDRATGFAEVVATATFVAWTHRDADGAWLYRAGPHGESPQRIPAGDARNLDASGSRLVYAQRGDIWLWEAARDAPENLTSDAPEQWFPWIDQDRVVWVDQVSNPSGSSLRPNNPDIVLFDLLTRARTRLTSDPPDRPALQYHPVIAGDQAVWVDLRDAPTPNPSQYLAEVMEIWGADLRTGRASNLVPRYQARNPAILDGSLFFTCRGTGRGGLYSIDLPR